MSPVEELLSKLLGPARILCVEDDESLALTLKSQIQRDYDCEVECVTTGEEAIQKLNATSYDLILLDLVLPGVSGVDVLQHVKRHKRPAPPVVVMTGYTESRLALDASRLGIVSLLAKPFDIAAIDDVFRLFKVRVRSRQDMAYFSSRVCDVPVAAPSAG